MAWLPCNQTRKDHYDFELEYSSDEEDEDWILNSINQAIPSCYGWTIKVQMISSKEL